jgi:hypothetical protein
MLLLLWLKNDLKIEFKEYGKTTTRDTNQKKKKGSSLVQVFCISFNMISFNFLFIQSIYILYQRKSFEN